MQTLLEDYKRRLRNLNELLSERKRDGSSDDNDKRRLSTKIFMVKSFIIDIERAIAREEERKVTNQPPQP